MKTKNKKNNVLPFFRYAVIGDSYLITNDSGEYSFVAPEDFEKMISGQEFDPWKKQYNEWREKGFLLDSYCNNKEFQDKYYWANRHLKCGPLLHIIIPTLRCNLNCIYCHASARSVKDTSYDMDIETAKKVVDTIFQAPDKYLTIEFQGGEPLLNWEVVSFVIDYATEKAAMDNRSLRLLLVSNFTHMTEEKLELLAQKQVALCTSIDGPVKLHNYNRGAHRKVIENVKKAFAIYSEKCDKHMPSGIVTVTKETLKQPREIVDLYVELGFEGVFARQINPLGAAVDKLHDIYYSVEEYLAFYEEMLDYIISINKQGTFFYESNAVILLLKILTGKSPNYMDLRSPCGGGIGQIAYIYNGDVYTCDEGRMLATMGDESFRMGNVHENSYSELIKSPPVKVLATASCTDGLPSCVNCVFKPYCGVCPVYNYAVEGDVFSKVPQNDRCRIYYGLFSMVFERLKDFNNLDIFLSWLK